MSPQTRNLTLSKVPSLEALFSRALKLGTLQNKVPSLRAHKKRALEIGHYPTFYIYGYKPEFGKWLWGALV